MTEEDRLETLFENHIERFTQPVEHRQRWCVGEIAGGVRLDHVGEIEVAALRLGAVHRLEGLLTDAENPESRRQHQSLLRARHGEVDAPLVHAKVDAGKRAHRVDVQQRRMTRVIHQSAHSGDVAGDAGRGLVLAGEHRLDLVPLVGAQYLLIALERHPLAPLHIEYLDVITEALRHIDPQVAELPEARGQYLVARRQRVRQRRLPCPRAGGWKDEDLTTVGLEDLLQVRQYADREFGKLGGAVILHGHHHRALYPIRHVGWSGDEEKVATGHARGHGSSP